MLRVSTRTGPTDQALHSSEWVPRRVRCLVHVSAPPSHGLKEQCVMREPPHVTRPRHLRRGAPGRRRAQFRPSPGLERQFQCDAPHDPRTDFVPIQGKVCSGLVGLTPPPLLRNTAYGHVLGTTSLHTSRRAVPRWSIK